MPRPLFSLLVAVSLAVSLHQFGLAALIHAKAWLAPILVQQAWEKSLAGHGRSVKPWPWADTWPVARLVVPSLGVTRYVLYGDSGHALACGPGHDSGSAPIGSEGVAVVGGHRDTHFAFLRRLRQGLLVEVELPDRRRRRYQVVETSVVDSSQGLLPVTHSGEQLLLVTCYPFGAINAAGPMRLVVRMAPAENGDGSRLSSDLRA